MTKIEHDLVTCALRDFLDDFPIDPDIPSGTVHAEVDSLIKKLSRYMDENCTDSVEKERAAVVSCLRNDPDPTGYTEYLAQRIERGEHRR